VRPGSWQGNAAGLAASCAAAVACLVALALLLPAAGSASGGEREADPLSTGPLAPRPAAGPIRDRVIEGERSRAAGDAAGFDTYSDGDGHTVRVRVSPLYSNPDAAAQDLVGFLGSLLHGDEMNRLTASLASPLEIRDLCGAGALACYYPFDEQMVVSGEDAGANEPPRELVIAHEYGHHVATNRNNRPWSALARGTKRWSTHEGICSGIKRGRIHTRNYFQNPGEAFAEAFAFYHYPNVFRWEWQIAPPDQGSFDAIFTDVRSPWSRRTSVESSGTLGPSDRRQVTRVETPLDGRMQVTLDGPGGADFDLKLVAAGGGRVLDRSLGRGADERLRYTVCGRRVVRIVVRASRGSGSYELTAERP
jgi:hypothetical protein